MSGNYIRGSPQRSSAKANQKHGTEGDSRMTFDGLFDRLKRSGLNCAVGEMFFRELRDGTDTTANFNSLAGFIWGLNTAGLITDDERRELYDILEEI